jgi:hypothetical protein
MKAALSAARLAVAGVLCWVAAWFVAVGLGGRTAGDAVAGLVAALTPALVAAGCLYAARKGDR